MPIINERWPRDLAPETCTFGRLRNDIRQTSSRTRRAHIIRRGRPLWAAQLSWAIPNTNKLAELRYWLESLDGFNGSAQIWNFGSPYPQGLSIFSDGAYRLSWSHQGAQFTFSGYALPLHWSYGSAVATSAAASAGATSVDLEGLDPNKPAVIRGQYVQIGRRLYVAADNATADASGEATVELTSGLIAAASLGAEVRLVEAACEMQLIEQNFDERARAGEGLIVVSASFIETVEDLT